MKICLYFQRNQLYYSRQPTLFCSKFIWKSYLCTVLGCACGAKAFPLLVVLWRASAIAALGTTINVFCYDALLGRASGTKHTTAEHRTYHLPVPSWCTLCYATDGGCLHKFNCLLENIYRIDAYMKGLLTKKIRPLSLLAVEKIA